MTYEEVLKNYYAVNELAARLVISEQERQEAIAKLREALGLPPNNASTGFAPTARQYIKGSDGASQ